MDSSIDKAKIREQGLQLRKERMGSDYEIKSRRISERLLQFCLDRQFKTIHTFLPITGRGEPDISLFIEQALLSGLNLMVPEVIRGELEMQHHWYRLQTPVRDGHWGVPVPSVSDLADPGLADAVLVPMLAVDKNGYRVGYGKGFYDYFLGTLDAVFIGVCFDDEIIENVPHEAHDVPVHYIISERRAETVVRSPNFS